MKLLLNILDNGSSDCLNRTLHSLKFQLTPQVVWEVLDCADFWKPDRNRLCDDADYVLFLYSGSVLEENAVEEILSIIHEKAPAWLYFNEKTYEAKFCDEPYGFLEKPDFDPLAFVQNCDIGEGIIFSRDCLNRMELHYEGSNFSAALAEMTIAAAMQVEPIHVRKYLLTRNLRMPFGQKEKTSISDGLIKYLHQCEEDLSGFPKTDGVGLHIYAPPFDNCKLSLIVLTDEPNFSCTLDASTTDLNVEMIPVTGDIPYWEKCIQGARMATQDTLCFIVPEFVDCSWETLSYLYRYASLPSAGIVSPRISSKGEAIYVGCYGAEAKQLTIARAARVGRGLLDDIMAVRETCLPAWQCWMVAKKLFLQLVDTEMDFLTREDYSKSYFLMECAIKVHEQGRKNLYVGLTALNGRKEASYDSSSSFYRMLYRYQDAFFKDRLCPVKLQCYIQQQLLNPVKVYFPEHMQNYNAEKRKILVLSHELSLTGAPIVLSHAVHILQQENNQVVVISPKDGPLRNTFLRENVPVIIMDDMDNNEDWLRWAADSDLVLVNTVVPFRQIQQLGKLRKPVMWWLHDARSGYEDHLRHVLPETKPENVHIFSVSKYADDSMKLYRPQYQSALLFYGLQDKAVEQPDRVERIKGSDGKKLFINIGTILRRKGQDVLVEAIRLLPDSLRKQCLFLFVGKCIERSIFDQVKMLEQDFPEEVRHIDSVSHDQIFNLYRQAAAVICSSRDDPLPTFMAETMMVSGVCICSENTGTASIIRHGENGFLYENDDPKELAQCIQLVFENKDLSRVKEESRKTFEQYFTMDIFRKNLMNCVEDCIRYASEGECK